MLWLQFVRFDRDMLHRSRRFPMGLWKKIGIYVLSPLCFATLGFVAHMELSNFFYPARAPEKSQNIEKMLERETAEDSMQAVGQTGQIITADTRFVVRYFDLSDSSRREEEEVLPEQYIGMDREQFLSAMDSYESSPSLTDLNKGFLSLDVERFSPEEVIIQKNYESNEKCTEFYLAVENNYVVVYEADKKTKYMSTGIPLSSLSEELIREIINFKYMGSEAELYNFLESYSS